MYDPTIHAKTIARQVRKTDFHKHPQLFNPPTLQAVINGAVQRGESGFTALPLKTSLLRGKYVYQFRDLEDELVARHISGNIKRVTSVRQDDRQFIIKCMMNILSEGLTFRVYKFDIKSFYESVAFEHILKRLERDVAFSGQSVKVLRSLFFQLDAQQIPGLPRGMSLSATLAEYLLRDLDRYTSTMDKVWFYARFVDDIAIITDGKEDPGQFADTLERRLPSGLHFNEKSLHREFSPFAKTNIDIAENSFDFLGYRFTVGMAHRGTDNLIKRTVKLDIAPGKTRKLKTRVAKSLLDYAINKDFVLLRDRIRLLTSNFNFTDSQSGSRRTSGIYYNYHLISASDSLSLPALDAFLTNVLASKSPKNKLRPLGLNKAQRQELLGLRFQDGFRNRRFFSFSAQRLAVLTKAWSYA